MFAGLRRANCNTALDGKRGRSMKRYQALAFTACLLLGAECATADILTYTWSESSNVYSGDPTITPGAAGPNYLTATFDLVAPNHVQLTLQANLTGLKDNQEDIQDVYFNVTPDSLLSNLSWTLGTNATAVETSIDNENAGPILNFDIKVSSGQGINGLLGNDMATVTFFLTDPALAPPSLTASSFLAQTPTPPSYFAAAHIQNTGSKFNNSSWAASNPPLLVGGELPSTPLPSTAAAGMALVTTLGLGRLLWGRRRRSSLA
jgi:hypothetical protein